MIIIIWIVFYLPRALTLNNFRYLIFCTLSLLQIFLLHITVSFLILFVTFISLDVYVFDVEIFSIFFVIISIIELIVIPIIEFIFIFINLSWVLISSLQISTLINQYYLVCSRVFLIRIIIGIYCLLIKFFLVFMVG